MLGLAGAADVPRLLEIRHAALSRHAPAVYSAHEVRTLLADVDEAEIHDMIGDRRLFIARSADQVLGLAGWQGERLRHVYVDPAHTRRGIGSRLVEHVEGDFGARTGADRILAGVALHAEPFYRRIGYELIERRRAWDGSGYLEMVRQLGVSGRRRSEVDRLLITVSRWAARRRDVVAVGLAGSWARGAQRVSSDVDLVVLTESPDDYIRSARWLGPFGDPPIVRTCRWGVLTERRVRLDSGLEIEFGFTTPGWASSDPVDAGTRRVAGDGLRPLHDPYGLLARLHARVRDGP